MSESNKVVVLGGGSFGVALAKLCAQKSAEVNLWARDPYVCQGVNQARHHPTRLSHILLPANITATTNLEQALDDADFVILALPMAALLPVLLAAKDLLAPHAILVSTAKGVVRQSLSLPCDIVRQALPATVSARACYLSGPSFALELALDLPTALTLASADQQAAMRFQDRFASEAFRLYRSDDVIGVCVGGALKNVIAIAAGASFGLGLGRNAMAALITRGLLEITRLAVCMGGRAETLSGLSGAGDLILSCTDDMSRNHRLGMLLSDGMDIENALLKIGSVVEGSETTKSIPALAHKYGIELPISMAVYRVLYEKEDVKSAMYSLLARKQKEEIG